MSFHPNPSYFEGDGPVCTWSASSFGRNPINFRTHVMWVKWWYHAKFQPFQSRWVFVRKPSYLEGDGQVCTRSASSFCHNPLNFCIHALWVKWWYHAKFQTFQNRWVFVWNPSYLEGDGPVCTQNASSFCCNAFNFCTDAMLVKWWYHAKFEPFQSRWVFVRNPSYLEGDSPVCTRSTSSVCRNPLTFYTCYVGEMMIPCKVSTFSE